METSIYGQQINCEESVSITPLLFLPFLASFRKLTTFIYPPSVIDTGSSGIYLPTAAAKRVNEAIAGSHYDIAGSRWLIPCDTGILPHEKHLGAIQRAHYFSIRLGGQVFVVPTVDLVLFPSNPIEIDLDKRTMCNSA